MTWIMLLRIAYVNIGKPLIVNLIVSILINLLLLDLVQSERRGPLLHILHVKDINN